jgi:Flp pilus assembly protein TadG
MKRNLWGAIAVVLLFVAIGAIGQLSISAGTARQASDLVFMAGVLVLCAALYFLPAIVGRHKTNAKAIFVLNLLLGWTLVGWVVAMVWAVTVDARAPRAPAAERGTALVESMLVLGMLLMMLFGIIEFGRAVYSYHFVAEVAREATRYASVRGTADRNVLNYCSDLPDCAIDQTGLAGYVNARATGIGIDTSQLTVAASWPVSATSPPVCNSVSNAPGCTVQVGVTYNFRFLLPFVPQTGIRMQSSSAMVISE